MRPFSRRTWLVAGASVGAALLALALLAPGSAGFLLAALAFVAWVLASLAVLLRRVWLRLTYRIGVRLFLSYLLVSVLPFLLFAVFLLVSGYMLVGQYTSARFGDLEVRIFRELQSTMARALDEAADGGVPQVTRFLRDCTANPPGEIPRLEWELADGGTVWTSGGVQGIGVPGWAGDTMWSGPVLVDHDRAFLAVVQRRGRQVLALLVPLDLATGKKISADNWFSVRFRFTRVGVPAGKAGESHLNITLGSRGSEEAGKSGAGRQLKVQGEPVPPEDVESGWLPRGLASGGLFAGDWVVWFRVGRQPRLWSSGGLEPYRRTLALLKSSPAGAFADLFGSPYRLGRDFLGAIGGIVVTFMVLYGVAVLLAGLMIVSITRSTARLSRGAREISRGNLDHRIPVKRRDQLGELAVSFNAMTSSIRGMIAEVKEKEHLARELELTREIQQSLLPRREVHHAGLTVDAHFGPAAAVGGDYFDIFTLADGRLTVTLGDVAGHGLPTGLLMAMVKSAVATLVRGGFRGPELLEHLNDLVLEQSLRHRMVTIAVADFDGVAGRVEITSAGHPPVLLMGTDGTVDEVMLSSLPVGYRWSTPPPSVSRPFPVGSRMMMYSDGLVETRDASGEAFGWARLRAALDGSRNGSGREVEDGVLGAVEAFLHGGGPTDDITILVVDHPRPVGRGHEGGGEPGREEG